MFAGGGDDEDAAGAGGPEVALGVDFEAIAVAGAGGGHEGFGVEEDAAVLHAAVALEVVGHDARGVFVRHGEVEGFFVGAKGDAVGPADVVDNEADLAVGVAAIDAVVGGVGYEAFFHAVGGIREEEGAAFGEDEVVGAVEAFAFESVGEDGEGAVGFHAGDAAFAVLAEDEAAFGVDGKAVGALAFADEVAAGFEEDAGGGVAVFPGEGGVFRDVGEDELVAGPDGAFGPVEAGGEEFDGGAGGDEGVEGGVEALDAAVEGGCLGEEREGGEEGEEVFDHGRRVSRSEARVSVPGRVWVAGTVAGWSSARMRMVVGRPAWMAIWMSRS